MRTLNTVVKEYNNNKNSNNSSFLSRSHHCVTTATIL